MGNVISKEMTVYDKIFKIEEDIIKTEAKIKRLKLQGSFGIITFVSIIAIPVISFIFYIEDFYPVSIFCILSLLLVSVKVALYHYKALRLSNLQDNLKVLKEQQKVLIKEYKKDSSFSMAKSLIDKYDEEECRDTFFEHIKKKKRESVEKLTDFVLGNDPATMNALICKKCGIHNGLIDQANNSFKYFYCYSCKERNDRKLN